MKGAEAKIAGAPFFQFYELTDHIKDIDSVEYLLYGILGDHADCKYNRDSGVLQFEQKVYSAPALKKNLLKKCRENSYV